MEGVDFMRGKQAKGCDVTPTATAATRLQEKYFTSFSPFPHEG